MWVRRLSITMLILGLMFTESVAAQDILPQFSLFRLSDDKVLIEWKNPDTSLRQLSIQLSADSAFGYRTILNIPDPRLAQNGTVINRPLAHKMYYRIYLQYPLGRYVFTGVKRPVPAPPAAKATQVVPVISERPPQAKTTIGPAIPPDLSKKGVAPPNTEKKKIDTIQAIRPITEPNPKEVVKKESEPPKPVPPIPETKKFTPSTHIFTQQDGYPFIELPEAWDLSQVQIRFFTENGQPLFEIDHPPIRVFRIDKTNFHRSGWYPFEIWLKGKKTETNKLFIPLEF